MNVESHICEDCGGYLNSHAFDCHYEFFVTRNFEHLAKLSSPPLALVNGVVKIAYGYNSGGYENFVYFVTKDGGALAIDTVIAEIGKVDFTDEYDPQWFIVGYEVNYGDGNYEDGRLYDDYTGKPIPSAYAD